MPDKYKQSLVGLTTSVASFLSAMDKIMEQPESEGRGKMIAKACNFLEQKNDAAMHFGLNYGFKKIENIKKAILNNL